jgi:multiple sugar transport system permease protein
MYTSKFRHNKKFVAYMFILPSLIYMLIFIGYPIIYNIILSLQDVTALSLSKGHQKFVGLDNFRILLNDGVTIPAFYHTVIYTFGCIVFQFVIGFLLALFFNNDFGLSKPIRGLVVISYILPETVTALTWKFMFGQTNGIINILLLKLHVISQPIGWLLEGKTALIALIIANTWMGIPFNMLLLTTGLTTIPKQLYEAASIDGATKFSQFRKITLPLLKPSIMSILVLGVIYTFKVFDLVFVMTKGGPVNATQVMSTYSYKLSFGFFKFGLGAAAANLLFLFLFIIALIYLFTVSKEEQTL